jgi:excisionase family DNA binding protein
MTKMCKGVPEWMEQNKTARSDEAAIAPTARPDLPGSAGGPRLLKVGDAAKILNVSEKTVRRLIERGELKPMRIGRSIRLHSEELEVFILDHGRS